MRQKILSVLKELKPESGKQLNPRVVARLQSHEAPLTLVARELMSSGNWAVKPKLGPESLADESSLHPRRKVRALGVGADTHLLAVLNAELDGGQSYPVLSAIFGAFAGTFSGGAARSYSL